MNVAFLFVLRAAALTLKQAPDAPVALPDASSDDAAAIAAGYEAEMAIRNTVDAMYANNNATVDGIQNFATAKVAETKAHLNATGERVIAEARGALMPASANRVLLRGQSARAGRRALNATHIGEVKNDTMSYYSSLLKNVTENLTNYTRNVTEYMHLALNASYAKAWWANGSAINSSGVANWTEVAVNATNQSLREVDRTRAFANAVDFKVQHAQMDA